MFKNTMEGVEIISKLEFREVIIDSTKQIVCSFLGKVEDPDSHRGTKTYIMKLTAWGDHVKQIATLGLGAVLNCTAGLVSKVSWQDWEGKWHTSQYPEGNIRTLEIVDDGTMEHPNGTPVQQNTEDPEPEISVEDAKKILEAAKKGKKELDRVKKELGI